MHEDGSVKSPVCSSTQSNARPMYDSCCARLQELPIYEPGLDEVVKAARDRNLFFSTDTHKHVAEGDIIFVRYACLGQAGYWSSPHIALHTRPCPMPHVPATWPVPWCAASLLPA